MTDPTEKRPIHGGLVDRISKVTEADGAPSAAEDAMEQWIDRFDDYLQEGGGLTEVSRGRMAEALDVASIKEGMAGVLATTEYPIGPYTETEKLIFKEASSYISNTWPEETE